MALSCRCSPLARKNNGRRRPLPNAECSAPPWKPVSPASCVSSAWGGEPTAIVRVAGVPSAVSCPSPVPHVSERGRSSPSVGWMWQGEPCVGTGSGDFRTQSVEVVSLSPKPENLLPPARPERPVRCHQRLSWKERRERNAWWGPPRVRLPLYGVTPALTSLVRRNRGNGAGARRRHTAHHSWS